MQSPRRPSRVPDEIIDAFRAVAPAIEGFARGNDLLIDRYRRGKSAWELRFARHLGGEAAITVSYRERTGHALDVSAIWWLDDFAQKTRRLRSEKVDAYLRHDPPALLVEQLEAALTRIEGWTLADLGPAHGPYRDWDRHESAEAFGADRANLPHR